MFGIKRSPSFSFQLLRVNYDPVAVDYKMAVVGLSGIDLISLSFSFPLMIQNVYEESR